MTNSARGGGIAEEGRGSQEKDGRDHGSKLDVAREELGHAVLDLILSHELRGAEVETLDLLSALREVGPVEHGGLLGNTSAHLQL